MKKLAIILASSVLGLGAASAADGAKVYATCSACHQPTGLGIPGAFPPLAGSEWVNGPVENLIRIQLRGLMGEITVKGVKYNSVMPPNATLSDEDIAAVLTHIRSNFGNTSSAVTAAQVKALRSEVGKPMLKATELVDPNKAPAEAKKPAKSNAQATPAAPTPAAEATKKAVAAKEVQATQPTSGKVTHTEHAPRTSEKLAFGGIAAWAALCILPVITGFGRKA